MFQRLKGAIDLRIAEEQARAKAAAVPARTASSTKRSTLSRNEFPITKSQARPNVADDGSRRPDPSEFEATFVIEDDSEEPSRAGTPALPVNIEGQKLTEMAHIDEPATVPSSDGANDKTEDAITKPAAPPELPTEVRSKLRRLEKLESRYQELLRSYRIAHARAVAIEPFEKTLKEHTPLTSISDPGALVEYLSQLNLRGDMVMEELRRVTTDRDSYQKKFEQSEKDTAAAREGLEALMKTSDDKSIIDGPETIPTSPEDYIEPKSQPAVKSPVSSVLGIFSPRQKTQTTAENEDIGESFFSYDEEIPKLQSDLEAKSIEIDDLKMEVKTLHEDLNKAKITNETLSQNLQSLEKQLSESKDLDRQEVLNTEIREIQEKLNTTTKALRDLEAQVGDQKKLSRESLAANAILSKDLTSTRQLREQSVSQLEELKSSKAEDEAKIKDLEQQLKTLRNSQGVDEGKVKDLESQIISLNSKLQSIEEEKVALQTAIKTTETKATSLNPPLLTGNEIPSLTVTGPKKKNKKKKKGGAPNSAATTAKVDENEDALENNLNELTDELIVQIAKLKEEIVERNLQIEKLQSKRKTEDDLREEIENMQENLLNIGQEHVEAKEKIKELQAEKKLLEGEVAVLEKEMTTHKNVSENSAKAEIDLKKMTTEYEELRVKSASLQSDLGAAQQLASSRYKDLTDLRDILQKAQPELKSLRSENITLKSTKDELATKTAELKRLESREKDFKSDFASFKKQAADKDSEIKSLNEKVAQETNGRLKAEDQARVAGRDLRRAEAEKVELSATGERATRELTKIQEETHMLRTVVQELESQVSKLATENQGFRDDIDLKGSQYATAQSLVGSMRDQTVEMATQLKEAKDQAESLEEELVEVQRLLGERTREGETMRRLLSDVDEKADTKVREMRERLEAAIEERDRAEDDASTNGRRRAREVEDLKNKIRDIERDLKRATDDRDELARSEKEWKRRRDEVEKDSGRAAQEVMDLNKAMEELRDALDTSEKQAREAEKQKLDLRKVLDDANQKYEKLQKTLKMKQQRLDELSSTSSRSSVDGGLRTNGSANGMMDYVYLKTVLLQFLEQRDKKLQAQLVPVLGKLLHFDKKDEQKWIAAISGK